MVALQVGFAVRTVVAGFILEIRTIDCFGKKLGDARLTGTSWSGKKIGMGDLVDADRID